MNPAAQILIGPPAPFHRDWIATNFSIAWSGEPRRVEGYVRRGLGVSHRDPGTAAITHLGSGHLIALLAAPPVIVFSIAEEILAAGDWDFEGIDGFRNRDPALRDKVRAILLSHRAFLAPRPAVGRNTEQANEIARERAYPTTDRINTADRQGDTPDERHADRPAPRSDSAASKPPRILRRPVRSGRSGIHRPQRSGTY